ncbi:DNA/RNA non-specific endonuclease [Adhaeribacter aquaticus]|uniref:DNA/RNA non-specific endonuclease n=1 Tax=Adhaeribacter aquaticus TaxID=299567 RepID=UPI00068879BE|nr:DNA/RNA non-specific endonuclease [Adhaeribacter aquaticus]
MRNNSIIFLVFVVLAGLFTALGTCTRGPESSQQASTETTREATTEPGSEAPVGNIQKVTGAQEHLLLGNPSYATADISNHNNYLLERPQYVLSYSRDRGTPNWVSWHVNKDWIGGADRQDNFRADPSLPADWYRASPRSYTNTGFDRGHNCPSADRTRTEEDNAATFLMTNIIPQAPVNNRETWGNMEEYTRSLVDAGNEVYVIMGSYGKGGKGATGSVETIDNGRITVPAYIWKVLVILPEGDNDLNRITIDTRVIAVKTANANTISPSWGRYRTTVDEIESETGYDLLSNVPKAIQDVLEAKRDAGPTRKE